jgi:DNA polymerase-3 subunit gamma/tau
VVSKLTQIAKKESIKIEPEALHLIARAATGSLRDAENLLEQMLTYYGDQISLKQVQSTLGITGDQRVKELAKHVVHRDVSAGIATINSVNSDGLDLRQFNRELVEYLRWLLLVKTGSEGAIDLTIEDLAELKELAGKAHLPQVLKAIRLFSHPSAEGLDSYSTLPLELALVDAALPVTEERPAPPPRVVETEPRPAVRTVTPSPVKQQTPKTPTPKATATKAQATPPPQTAESTAPPTLEAGGSEIDQLKKNWWQFIRGAPLEMGRTPAAALLRSARPKAIEQDVLVLSFRFPLHKDQMEKVENQQIAEKIVSHFLKRTCRVRCIYEPEDNHLVEEALRIGAQIIEPPEEK